MTTVGLSPEMLGKILQGTQVASFVPTDDAWSGKGNHLHCKC